MHFNNSTYAFFYSINDLDRIMLPHWKQFVVIDPIYHYIIGTIMGAISITAIIGNVVVIAVFSCAKKLRTLPTIFILNLAISDLTFSFIDGLLLKTISMFNTRWAFNADICIFYGILGSITGFASLELNTMIAIERYLVIVKPIKDFNKAEKPLIFFMVLIAWMCAIVWSVPPLFGYGKIVLEGFHTHCSFDFISKDFGTKVYMTIIFGFGFCSNILIIGFCYTNVLLAIRRHEKEMNVLKWRHRISSKRQSSYSAIEMKATRVSIMCFGGFLFSFSPYALTCFISILGQNDALTPFILEIPGLCLKASAVYNPIIYAISHRKFRTELRKKCIFN